jgi:hypothetical protein
MAKHAGGKLSFSDLSHGKKLCCGTADHMKPVESHSHKPGHVHASSHGKAAHEPKHTGYIDWAKPVHDAKGHDVGSRGPFTSAHTGKHRHKG